MVTLTRVRAVLLILASTTLLPVGCANCGDDTGMDGSTSRRDGGGIRRLPDGRVVAPDGYTPPPGGSVDPCGANQQMCCRGDACDLGLRCDTAAGECCARAGGAPCGGPEDCCSGLVCEAGKCFSPEGTTCIGSSDCLPGLACPDGACIEPESGMGGAGEPCIGGSTCRSGFVCGDDTMCTACGRSGEPCCDGSGACGTSDALVCVSDMCVTPTDCGSAGMTCCEGDICVASAPCTGGTCVAAADPGSPGATCGADGQMCCPGNRCGFGTICDTILSNTCIGIMTVLDVFGFDCGGDGQLCCFPGFTCEGNLDCDFLFCSGDCGAAQGDTCESSDDCCDTALCLPSPFNKRCCRGAGDPAASRLECCGWMELNAAGDACACSADADQCIEDNECCGGSCKAGRCTTASACTAPNTTACTSADMCCPGLTCDTIEQSDLEEDQCCATKDSGCRNDFDCCGWMQCTGDVCVCTPRGQVCTSESECCDGSQCFLGRCVEDDGCGVLQVACETSGDTCCRGASCQRVGSATGPTQCCTRDGQFCTANDDCCGAMTCNTGTELCECRASGETCVAGDCCAGLCNDGTCS